jgi:apolipoprotein N-acyltransferase
MSDFLPGPGFSPVPVGREKAGILICYESIFPEISRQYKRSGAGLLVNITNDAWFDRSSAPYQHLSMAAFRAIENRMYVARAANTGISAIIDPCGRVSVSTGLFERSTLQGHVKFIKVDTFYSDYGDWPVPVCFIMLAAAGAAAIIRRKK